MSFTFKQMLCTFAPITPSNLIYIAYMLLVFLFPLLSHGHIMYIPQLTSNISPLLSHLFSCGFNNIQFLHQNRTPGTAIMLYNFNNISLLPVLNVHHTVLYIYIYIHTHTHTHWSPCSLLHISFLYEGGPESIRPFWISREPVAWPWCNSAASQRRPYCASVNIHSPVRLISRQWDAVDWACVVCGRRIHQISSL